MKQQTLLVLAASLVLFASCGSSTDSTNERTSASEATSSALTSSKTNASSLETASSTSEPVSSSTSDLTSSKPEAAPIVTLTYQNFSSMSSSGYPAPADITVDSSVFYVENCAQGGGDHLNTIQIKALKKETQGIIYNTSAIHATKIVVDELNTTSSGYEYRGQLTAYAGTTANPNSNETTAQLIDKTDGERVLYHCVYTFASSFDYFRLIATSNAVYAVSISFFA